MCYTGKCRYEQYSGECNGKYNYCPSNFIGAKFLIIDLHNSLDLDKAKFPYESFCQVLESIEKDVNVILTNCLIFSERKYLCEDYNILLTNKEGNAYLLDLLPKEYVVNYPEYLLNNNDRFKDYQVHLDELFDWTGVNDIER